MIGRLQRLGRLERALRSVKDIAEARAADAHRRHADTLRHLSDLPGPTEASLTSLVFPELLSLQRLRLHAEASASREEWHRAANDAAAARMRLERCQAWLAAERAAALDRAFGLALAERLSHAATASSGHAIPDIESVAGDRSTGAA